MKNEHEVSEDPVKFVIDLEDYGREYDWESIARDFPNSYLKVVVCDPCYTGAGTWSLPYTLKDAIRYLGHKRVCIAPKTMYLSDQKVLGVDEDATITNFRYASRMSKFYRVRVRPHERPLFGVDPD